MAEFVFDMEWKVPEGGDVIRDAEKVWCAVFKEVGKDNWHEFYGDLLDNHYIYDDPVQKETNSSASAFYIWLNIKAQKSLTLIAHNMIGADLHIMRKFLGIHSTIFPDTIMGIPCKFIDTLSWSRRLWPDRPAVKGSKSIHGLEAWGIRTGVAKPQVHDWSDQPLDVYLNRCREDCKINEATYELLKKERGL